MWSSPARACNYFMPRVFEILRDEVCHGIRGLRAVTKQALRAPSLHTSPGIRRHRNDGGTNANTIPKTLSPTPTTRYETDTLAAEPIRPTRSRHGDRGTFCASSAFPRPRERDIRYHCRNLRSNTSLTTNFPITFANGNFASIRYVD